VVRKAISVLKRRSGPHATDIRELLMKPRIAVGEQLSDLQGVFTGVPRRRSARRRPRHLTKPAEIEAIDRALRPAV
jgi:hypothetical protein